MRALRGRHISRLDDESKRRYRHLRQMWASFRHVNRRFQLSSSSSRKQLNIWRSESSSRLWICVLYAILSTGCSDIGGKGTRSCASLAHMQLNMILSRTEISVAAPVRSNVAIEPQESTERCEGSGVGDSRRERARRVLGEGHWTVTEDERDKDGNPAPSLVVEALRRLVATPASGALTPPRSLILLRLRP